MKWLRTQNEIARLKFGLREAQEYSEKLQALTQHTHGHLRSEISARTRAQKEKRALVSNYFDFSVATSYTETILLLGESVTLCSRPADQG